MGSKVGPLPLLEHKFHIYFFSYFDKPDNFIGRAFYLLKSTPIDGEYRTLSLYSHSGKHERGVIDLHLTIKGQQEDVPVNVSIREHTLLLKLIINREAKTVSF